MQHSIVYNKSNRILSDKIPEGYLLRSKHVVSNSTFFVVSICNNTSVTWLRTLGVGGKPSIDVRDFNLHSSQVRKRGGGYFKPVPNRDTPLSPIITSTF